MGPCSDCAPARWVGLCVLAAPAVGAGLSDALHHHDRAVRGRRQFGRECAADHRIHEQDLGQRFILENVPGAGGLSGLTRLTQSPADGYTIALGNSGTNTAVYLFNPEVKFTPDDFAPIGLFTRSSAVVAIKREQQANTLAEFIAYAKANPGKVTIGHSGIGSQNYLLCKTFIQAAGINVTLVGYRGGGPALNDLIGGQIDGLCDFASSATQAIRRAGEGRSAGLACATAEPAKRSDVGRGRLAGISDPGLVRAVRAEGYAGADHRKAQRRLAQGHRQTPITRRSWTRSARTSPRTARSRRIISRPSFRARSRNSRACWPTASRRLAIRRTNTLREQVAAGAGSCASMRRPKFSGMETQP